MNLHHTVHMNNYHEANQLKNKITACRQLVASHGQLGATVWVQISEGD